MVAVPFSEPWLKDIQYTDIQTYFNIKYNVALLKHRYTLRLVIFALCF